MSSAKEMGDLLEQVVREALEGELQPGSGNKWFARLDVDGTQILISCKATANMSRPLAMSDIVEMDEVASGSGGTGQIPALVIGLDGDLRRRRFGSVTITFLLEDFIEYMTERSRIELHRGARAETVRERADVPELLRDDETPEGDDPTPNSASPEVTE